MTDAQPTISFLYCNYNASKMLEEALRSVREAAADYPHEIIVVDDVSPDDSVAMVRGKFPEVELIVNRETLWSQLSFNESLKVARGRYLYFLGTDTVLFKGTLEKLLPILDKDESIGALTCKTFFPNGDFQQNACRDHDLAVGFLTFTFLGLLFPGWKRRAHDEFVYKGWNWDEDHEIEASGLTNLVVRKSAFDAVGPFDPGMKQYFSENDLCLRLRAKGWKILYVAGGKVTHHLRGSVSKNIDKIARNYEQDAVYYYKKYYGIGIALLLKICILVSNALLSIKYRRPTRIFTRFLVPPSK